MGANALSWRLCPPLTPPPSEEKNGQNQPFLANVWIFALRIAFCPLDAPHKKISGAATD